MEHQALRVIRDEHATLAAMLQSLLQMMKRGPEPGGMDEHERFFDVVRAMLFYICEFPEKMHHPKESELLFPRLARAAPQMMCIIDQLERDHMSGEHRVRVLMYQLMAWEYLGDERRPAFEDEVKRYVAFYLKHIQLEETELLPEAERSLTDADWRALNAAFASNLDPLSSRVPRNPQYDRLFTRIVMTAPAPVGLGVG